MDSKEVLGVSCTTSCKCIQPHSMGTHMMNAHVFKSNHMRWARMHDGMLLGSTPRLDSCTTTASCFSGRTRELGTLLSPHPGNLFSSLFLLRAQTLPSSGVLQQ
jgi:hypothetical protein